MGDNTTGASATGDNTAGDDATPEVKNISFNALVGYDVESPEPGKGRGRLVITQRHLNRGGITHGGAIATLCDSAMGHAVGSLRRDGEGQATATMTVTYLYPANVGDVIVAEAAVRKKGRAMVMVEAVVIRESDGRELATASATFATFPRRR